MTDLVHAQKERERRLREREVPFGLFTVTAKTRWWNMIEIDNVLDRLHLPSGVKIWDVGCSDGRVLARLKERGRGDVVCVGTDFALNPLQAFKAGHPGVALCCADAAMPLFKENIFDAVISLQVLQQLPSRSQRLLMLKAIHAALRPGGQIAVSVLNRPSWASLVANGIEGPLLSSPELFVHLYDASELKDDFEASGFRVREIVAINNFPVRYLKCLGMAGVWLDKLITSWVRGVSRNKGRYLLGIGVKV